jgi:GNAT superfamily N-acetyltransferase
MSDARPRTPESLWRVYSYVPLRLAHSSEYGEALVRPGGLLAMAGVADADWNWAFVYGPDDPVAALETFVAELRRRGLPGYVVAPEGLAEQLARVTNRLGVRSVDGIPLLLSDGTVPPAPVHAPAPSLTVEPISQVDTFLEAREVVGAAFADTGGYARTAYRPVLLDLPGVHTFAVREEGVIAGYAATIDEGGVIWFFDVGTHPDHRHKGVATALLLGAMDWWRERGRRTFGLGAEPEARALYESLGFRVVAESRVWLVEGPGHQGRPTLETERRP